MKKYILWIIISIAIVFAIVYFSSKTSNTDNNTNYNSARTSQKISDESDNAENIKDTDSNETANDENDKNQTNENNNETNPEEESNSKDETNNKDSSKNKNTSKETEIASFTTKIYTKDSGRQNNLSIACSTLNNTTVENGKTFSFSKTVGRATSGKGYKKADVFRNGDVIEALGGGLCQVSTTLYNAVLKIPELKVTERHPHSNKVPYIKSGKDAAVSFGAQDFKFVNNTGNTIKIKASNTKNNVTIKIFKIE